MSSHSFIYDPKNENIFININGDLYPRSEAKISVFDSGFLLGDGVWEGIRLHQSKLMFIDEHLDRLFESAAGISLNIPFSKINPPIKAIGVPNPRSKTHTAVKKKNIIMVKIKLLSFTPIKKFLLFRINS